MMDGTPPYYGGTEVQGDFCEIREQTSATYNYPKTVPKIQKGECVYYEYKKNCKGMYVCMCVCCTISGYAVINYLFSNSRSWII